MRQIVRERSESLMMQAWDPQTRQRRSNSGEKMKISTKWEMVRNMVDGDILGKKNAFVSDLSGHNC